MADRRLPKRRLSHVAKLQWEIDAWLQHCTDFSITMNISDHKMQKQIDALEKASQLMFDAFGNPDLLHKAKNV